ncbi:MAG: hypothetical protein PHQ75_03645 [Thermoguttaceae bacterium]|nr:hypothetical protein [Thermoguttaceae bacterium]
MRKDDPQYSFVPQVSITTPFPKYSSTEEDLNQADIHELLTTLVVAQHRQNDLLEEIVEQLGAAQRQRLMELANWKRMNPHLAQLCHLAAQKLNKVQTEFLTSMSQEIEDNYENMLDSEYSFNDFLDSFGPRLMHLNLLMQMLTQLGSASEINKTKP